MNNFHVVIYGKLSKRESKEQTPENFGVLFYYQIDTTIKDVLRNTQPGDFIYCWNPYFLGDSVDEFLRNGLECVKSGVKVLFKSRPLISFENIIDYDSFKTTDEQCSAFLACYGMIMPNIYAHKNGMKSGHKAKMHIRNYWLAYIWHNCKDYKGTLGTNQLCQILKTTRETISSCKKEINSMLRNGNEEELNNLESQSGFNVPKTDKAFEDKLVKSLSSKATQLELFSSEETEY